MRGGGETALAPEPKPTTLAAYEDLLQAAETGLPELPDKLATFNALADIKSTYHTSFTLFLDKILHFEREVDGDLVTLRAKREELATSLSLLPVPAPPTTTGKKASGAAKVGNFLGNILASTLKESAGINDLTKAELQKLDEQIRQGEAGRAQRAQEFLRGYRATMLQLRESGRYREVLVLGRYYLERAGEDADLRGFLMQVEDERRIDGAARAMIEERLASANFAEVTARKNQWKARQLLLDLQEEAQTRATDRKFAAAVEAEVNQRLRRVERELVEISQRVAAIRQRSDRDPVRALGDLAELKAEVPDFPRAELSPLEDLLTQRRDQHMLARFQERVSMAEETMRNSLEQGRAIIDKLVAEAPDAYSQDWLRSKLYGSLDQRVVGEIRSLGAELAAAFGLLGQSLPDVQRSFELGGLPVLGVSEVRSASKGSRLQARSRMIGVMERVRELEVAAAGLEQIRKTQLLGLRSAADAAIASIDTANQSSGGGLWVGLGAAALLAAGVVVALRRRQRSAKSPA